MKKIHEYKFNKKFRNPLYLFSNFKLQNFWNLGKNSYTIKSDSFIKILSKKIIIIQNGFLLN